MSTPNPNDNPENQFAIGRRMKVRKLAGEYEIVDSRLLGKNRRYDLRAIPGSGAALVTTEAWGADMQPAPDPAPVARPATDAQELRAPDGQPVPAPAADDAAPDAIRSPAAGPDAGFTLDAGAFGGELDEYSVGARYPDEPGELRNPMKPVRNWPKNPTYQDLRGIVYNARFKGLEKLSSAEIDRLEPGTPIAVAVSHETNGHAIWIVTTEGDDIRGCRLEVFYPHATGSSADAIEYAVLLALRQVPIRTEDLEILLLELSN